MNIFTRIRQFSGLKPMLIALVVISVYYLFKVLFVNTGVFQSFELYYAKLLVIVLNTLASGFSIDLSVKAIVFNENVSYFSHVLVAKYYLLSALVLFIFPREIKKSVIIYMLVSLAFFLLTVCRLLLQSYFSSDLVSFLIDLIISFRYLILYKLLIYKLQLFESTRLLLGKWDAKIRTTFVFSLNGLLTIVVFIRALTGLFDWFLVAKWNVFVVFLTKLILILSNAILWLLGYAEAYTWDKFLLLKNYWLFLDANCLGVGLMVVFCLLIGAIRSPLINKIVFLGFGLVTIIFMNAIRLVSILLYIYTNQIPAPLIKDYHDLSNNIFYVVVFFVILLYINWFQFIKFRKKTSNKLQIHIKSGLNKII